MNVERLLCTRYNVWFKYTYEFTSIPYGGKTCRVYTCTQAIYNTGSATRSSPELERYGGQSNKLHFLIARVQPGDTYSVHCCMLHALVPHVSNSSRFATPHWLHWLVDVHAVLVYLSPNNEKQEGGNGWRLVCPRRCRAIRNGHLESRCRCSML